MSKIINVSGTDPVIVTYETGTIRRYQAGRIPSTVTAWMAAQPSADICGACTADTPSAPMECTTGTPSSVTALDLPAVAAVAPDLVRMPVTLPSNHADQDTVMLTAPFIAEMSLLILAGVGVWCAWWTVKAIQMAITATEGTVKSTRRVWANIWPSVRENAREMALRASRAWSWRAELIAEAA